MLKANHNYNDMPLVLRDTSCMYVCVCFILCILVVLVACKYVYYVHIWCLQRSEIGIRSPGIGVMDEYLPLCEHWELIPCHLEEQQVALAAKPSLQVPLKCFN